MSIFEPDRSAERMPVSVITGFLGSGKTTLLNRLLRHPGMGDSAVIINEFGEVGLDHHLVEALDGEVAVLASGCVCCTLRSDLEATLRDLLARRDRGAIPPFRRVLVETTGLADPAPILQLLLANPLLVRFVRLDAVAATVDAVHGERQLDREPEAVRQVAMADVILLTKVDLAGPAASLRRRLTALNPGARVLEAPFGEVPPEALFEAEDACPARRVADLRRRLDAAPGHGSLLPQAEVPAGGRPRSAHGRPASCEAELRPAPQDEDLERCRPEGEGDEGHHHRHHHHGVETIAIVADEPLEWDGFQAWLARLRSWHGEHLLRVKGLLNLRGEDGPVAIHGVHHVFHSPTRLARWPDGDRRSRIVFITRGLGREQLLASWREHVGRPELVA